MKIYFRWKIFLLKKSCQKSIEIEGKKKKNFKFLKDFYIYFSLKKNWVNFFPLKHHFFQKKNPLNLGHQTVNFFNGEIQIEEFLKKKDQNLKKIKQKIRNLFLFSFFT